MSKTRPGRDQFYCPDHQTKTKNGWCWKCAVETFGEDLAKKIYRGVRV